MVDEGETQWVLGVYLCFEPFYRTISYDLEPKKPEIDCGRSQNTMDFGAFGCYGGRGGQKPDNCAGPGKNARPTFMIHPRGSTSVRQAPSSSASQPSSTKGKERERQRAADPLVGKMSALSIDQSRDKKDLQGLPAARVRWDKSSGVYLYCLGPGNSGIVKAHKIQYGMLVVKIHGEKYRGIDVSSQVAVV
ncbi:MAG: hypothetical protein Q9169_006399 [Polycauliona sp. 2 TL-2023]